MTQTMGQRVFAVHLLIEGALGERVTLADLGVLVGKAMGRRAFSATSVRDWEVDVSRPDDHVVRALVAVAAGLGVEVDPGWLMFGEESRAPEPEGLARVLTKPLSLARSRRRRK